MLLQPLARDLANDYEAVVDCYRALELITGEDLSGHSVNDLLKVAIDNLGPGRLVDIWRVAFDIGLLDEEALQRWVVYEELTDDGSTTDGRRATGPEH